MNKQEVIEEIKTCKSEYDSNSRDVWSYEKGFEDARSSALNSINKLDEPEKPLLSKEEAEWFEGLKKSLADPSKINLAYFITRQGWGYLFEYTLFEYTDGFEETKHVLNPELYRSQACQDDLKERLLNAVLYGYEVEKEKFYTAKLKSTGEYLHYDEDYNKVHHTFAFDTVAKQSKHYHFTKAELVKYSAWENDAYDVKEVKE